MIHLFKKYHQKIFIIFIILIIFSLSLTRWFAWLESFRLVFGSIFVLFLPGFFFTLIFFPLTKSFQGTFSSEALNKDNFLSLGGVSFLGQLDWLERTILSVFFSLILITLILAMMRYLEIRLTARVVFLVIFILNVISIAGALAVNFMIQRRKEGPPY